MAEVEQHADVTMNPLKKVFDAFWGMLESHNGFTAQIATKNRIKFNTDDRDPMKDQMSSADFPEVRIVPVGITPHLERTSTSSSLLMRLEIQVSTGDQRIHPYLYPCTWSIYRALLGWRDKLTDLRHLGKEFVKLCRPVEIGEGVSNMDLNRGIAGWSAIWSAEIELWFVTEDIRPEGV